MIGCEATGYIVPHEANYQSGDVIFWRVPTECPLSDAIVSKSDKQANKKDWVTLRIDTIREVTV